MLVSSVIYGRGFNFERPFQKETAIFHKKVVVSFCSLNFSLFIILPFLKLSFPDKRYEIRDKRKGTLLRKALIITIIYGII